MKSSATPLAAPPQHSPVSSTGSSRDRRPDQGCRLDAGHALDCSGRAGCDAAARGEEDRHHEDRQEDGGGKGARGEEGPDEEARDHEGGGREGPAEAECAEGSTRPRRVRSRCCPSVRRAPPAERHAPDPTDPVELSPARRLAAGSDDTADEVVVAAVTEGPTEPETTAAMTPRARPEATATTGEATTGKATTGKATTGTAGHEPEAVDLVEVAEPDEPSDALTAEPTPARPGPAGPRCVRRAGPPPAGPPVCAPSRRSTRSPRTTRRAAPTRAHGIRHRRRRAAGSTL